MKHQILLTRPEGENEKLAALLQVQSSCQCIIRPLVQLLAIEANPLHKQTAMNLDHYDKIIFVSKSAVRFGLPLLGGYWPQWPESLQWFAVGPGTAALLAEYGIKAAFPKASGSEGLLAMPEAKVTSEEKILVLRGPGGREHLARELTRRGARVEYLAVYERASVTYDDWQCLQPGNVIVLTSVEILRSFMQQAAHLAPHLRAVVASRRIGEAALKAGFQCAQNASGASVQALYDAILRLMETVVADE